MGVLETHLSDKTFMVGNQFSIADMSLFPWVMALEQFYHAKEEFQLEQFESTYEWLNRCLDRPASQKGLTVCHF